MKLNDRQFEAVTTTEGPLLVIAGAGSGKTRVLTERLALIIEQGLAAPHEILTVTFTNKAAGEIKDRALKRLQDGGRLIDSAGQLSRPRVVSNIPWMGTFHSIAVRMLRADGQYIGIDNNFTIYDADDQLTLVKAVLKQKNLNSKTNNPRSILAGISGAKSELIKPKDFALQAHGYYQEIVAEVYAGYQALLRQNKALDFDDLLVYTVELLQSETAAAAKYKQLFRYVMVDEYQDTNKVQYMMVKLLSELHGNICVVGDDDQSIYGWRGANVRNILEFERDFPGAKVVKLEQNYRSSKKIIATGNAIVSKISGRKEKSLWTENDEGENIALYSAMDEKEESYWVVEQIEQILEGPDAEIGVLYRMNSQSRALEEALLQAGIAYKIVGNVRFYDRKEIKDMIAYLRVLFNPADELSLLRIINVPSRKIGAKTIDSLLKNARSVDMSPLDYLKAQAQALSGGLKSFAQLYLDLEESADRLSVDQILKNIFISTGYKLMLDDGTEEGEGRIGNIEELINVASKYAELSPQASLQSFLEEVALVEAQSNQTAEGSRVTLMTVHSAKGLEFDTVFVCGLEEGLFPHSRAFTSTSDLEEERRLAYVAVTRAKKKLSLSYANSRYLYGSSSPSVPSRFLSDVDTSIVDFSSYNGLDQRRRSVDSWDFERKHSENSKPRAKFNVAPGDYVTHQLFGKGRVISIDEDTVAVDFLRVGRKELATEYAQLQKA